MQQSFAHQLVKSSPGLSQAELPKPSTSLIRYTSFEIFSALQNPFEEPKPKISENKNTNGSRDSLSKNGFSTGPFKAPQPPPPDNQHPLSLLCPESKESRLIKDTSCSEINFANRCDSLHKQFQKDTWNCFIPDPHFIKRDFAQSADKTLHKRTKSSGSGAKNGFLNGLVKQSCRLSGAEASNLPQMVSRNQKSIHLVRSEKSILDQFLRVEQQAEGEDVEMARMNYRGRNVNAIQLAFQSEQPLSQTVKPSSTKHAWTLKQTKPPTNPQKKQLLTDKIDKPQGLPAHLTHSITSSVNQAQKDFPKQHSNIFTKCKKGHSATTLITGFSANKREESDFKSAEKKEIFTKSNSLCHPSKPGEPPDYKSSKPKTDLITHDKIQIFKSIIGVKPAEQEENCNSKPICPPSPHNPDIKFIMNQFSKGTFLSPKRFETGNIFGGKRRSCDYSQIHVNRFESGREAQADRRSAQQELSNTRPLLVQQKPQKTDMTVTMAAFDTEEKTGANQLFLTGFSRPRSKNNLGSSQAVHALKSNKSQPKWKENKPPTVALKSESLQRQPTRPGPTNLSRNGHNLPQQAPSHYPKNTKASQVFKMVTDSLRQQIILQKRAVLNNANLNDN